VSRPDPLPREPVFTPRLQVGFGLLVFGLGLMFLAGKVLPVPVPAGIAGGITLAIVGFVAIVVEALRDPIEEPEESADSRNDGPAASHH
jgi:hypothetical protein